MKHSDERCAVLMVSCDAYRDTWTPFFELFTRYWPDCPYPIYHLANNSEFTFRDVRPVRVGQDRSWSDNLLAGLRQLPEPYVLLMLDDLFLVRPVETAAVQASVNWFIERQGNHLRLNAFPKPEVRISDEFGEISPGSAYRVSTVLTVWRKETLISLLRQGESAWQFELAGTVRSDAIGGFYSTTKPLMIVENTIIKRKWRRSSLRRLARIGIRIDTGSRTIMSTRQDMEIRLRIVANRLLHIFPTAWRRPLQSVVHGEAFKHA